MRLARIPQRWRKDQRGLVIVYFAMTLTLMMVCAAYVVDLGSWYSRGQKLQRAADAAALAGVAFMPGNFAQAQAAALEVAAKNGFDPTTNSNIAVNVTADADSSERLDVTISDSNVPRYFSQTFASGKYSMSRSSKAEFLPSTPMGSPENDFGLGTLGGGNATNSWAAVAGWCTPKEGGDRFSSKYDGELVSGSWNCNSPSATNTEYDALGYHGYYYNIVVPTARKSASDSIVIWAYDPSYNPYWYSGFSSASCPGAQFSPDYPYSPTTNNSYAVTTHFDVLGTDGTTVLASQTYTSVETGPGSGSHGDSSHCGWQTIATLPSSTPAGTYQLHVYTEAGQANSFGVNAFALEAAYSSQGNPVHNCTSISGAGGYQNWCINIYAQDAMTAFTYTGKNVGGTSKFYLAAVPKSRAGSTMTITLWDPGDGLTSANNIQVINPDGNKLTAYSWSVASTGHCGSAPLCSGTTDTNGLDTSGSTTDPPNTNLQGTGMYNDRLLTITVPIPNNYNPPNASGGWWMLNYTYNGNTNFQDLTTWTVSVSGSPVHLVNH
jgi:hypothetical protein